MLYLFLFLNQFIFYNSTGRIFHVPWLETNTVDIHYTGFFKYSVDAVSGADWKAFFFKSYSFKAC